MFYNFDNPAFFLHYKIVLYDYDMKFYFDNSGDHGIIGYATISPMSASLALTLAGGSDELPPPYCGKLLAEVSRKVVNGTELSFLLIGVYLINIANEDADRLINEDLDIVIGPDSKTIELVPAQ